TRHLPSLHSFPTRRSSDLDNSGPAAKRPVRDVDVRARWVDRNTIQELTSSDRRDDRVGLGPDLRGIDHRNAPVAGVGDIDARAGSVHGDTDRQIADTYLGNNAVARGVDH